MAKYNLPLTYKPKIDAVISGACTQTIRAGRRFEVGDLVSFHGWEGKSYRSKWSFRTPYRELRQVLDITINKKHGIIHEKYCYSWDDDWDCATIKKIAKLDYINPPTGEALCDVLFGLNAKQGSHFEAQIIRW
jgi:hypothetical protein